MKWSVDQAGVWSHFADDIISLQVGLRSFLILASFRNAKLIHLAFQHKTWIKISLLSGHRISVSGHLNYAVRGTSIDYRTTYGILPSYCNGIFIIFVTLCLLYHLVQPLGVCSPSSWTSRLVAIILNISACCHHLEHLGSSVPSEGKYKYRYNYNYYCFTLFACFWGGSSSLNMTDFLF